MSKMGSYNIDVWNAAFELKSVAVKYGISVETVYKDLEHCIYSDKIDE